MPHVCNHHHFKEVEALGNHRDHRTQVVNLVSNRVARILGKVENTERFLRIALYQGIPGAAAKAKRAGLSGMLVDWLCF